jgi:hypothetical protein
MRWQPATRRERARREPLSKDGTKHGRRGVEDATCFKVGCERQGNESRLELLDLEPVLPEGEVGGRSVLKIGGFGRKIRSDLA